MYFSEEPFYTKLEVSKKCCSIIKQFIDINFENDIIIEPSAGNGSFIPELLKMSLNCYFRKYEERRFKAGIYLGGFSVW